MIDFCSYKGIGKKSLNTVSITISTLKVSRVHLLLSEAVLIFWLCWSLFTAVNFVEYTFICLIFRLVEISISIFVSIILKVQIISIILIGSIILVKLRLMISNCYFSIDFSARQVS